jgi:hypothetical protein
MGVDFLSCERAQTLPPDGQTEQRLGHCRHVGSMVHERMPFAHFARTIAAKFGPERSGAPSQGPMM